METEADARWDLAMRLRILAGAIKEWNVYCTTAEEMEGQLMKMVVSLPLESQEVVCGVLEKAYEDRLRVEFENFELYKAAIAQVQGNDANQQISE